ncbi:MAG: hypothetical protein CMP38_02160 [Rickettsiales bacterium]|mgnify:CR=1 FL=1|nr:hypothetical protein [Rickettsiales bacterium]|tara:strand:+ start:1329 stop:2087 length:759 start_codon:yes stop_codon:yes gene_type:complete
MIIISPAKNLNILPEKSSLELSEPLFTDDTNLLIRKLKDLKFDKLKNLMKISDSLTELNFQRFQDFNSNDNVFKPAVFLFSGDTFNGLSIRLFSKELLLLAQNRLRILSGLYGLLRPLDLVQPYRLEMGTKIDSILGISLHEFWKKKITSCLNNDLSKNKTKFLFNLSSQEYFESIDKNNLNAKVVSFDFKIFKDNKLKAPGMMIKKYRGIMAKFIITNKIFDIEELKKFNEEGFEFDSYDEPNNKLLFISK